MWSAAFGSATHSGGADAARPHQPLAPGVFGHAFGDVVSVESVGQTEQHEAAPVGEGQAQQTLHVHGLDRVERPPVGAGTGRPAGVVPPFDELRPAAHLRVEKGRPRRLADRLKHPLQAVLARQGPRQAQQILVKRRLRRCAYQPVAADVQDRPHRVRPSQVVGQYPRIAFKAARQSRIRIFQQQQIEQVHVAGLRRRRTIRDRGLVGLELPAEVALAEVAFVEAVDGVRRRVDRRYAGRFRRQAQVIERLEQGRLPQVGVGVGVLGEQVVEADVALELHVLGVAGAHHGEVFGDLFHHINVAVLRREVVGAGADPFLQDVHLGRPRLGQGARRHRPALDQLEQLRLGGLAGPHHLAPPQRTEVEDLEIALDPIGRAGVTLAAVFAKDLMGAAGRLVRVGGAKSRRRQRRQGQDQQDAPGGRHGTRSGGRRV